MDQRSCVPRMVYLAKDIFTSPKNRIEFTNHSCKSVITFNTPMRNIISRLSLVPYHRPTQLLKFFSYLYTPRMNHQIDNRLIYLFPLRRLDVASKGKGFDLTSHLERSKKSIFKISVQFHKITMFSFVTVFLVSNIFFSSVKYFVFSVFSVKNIFI